MTDNTDLGDSGATDNATESKYADDDESLAAQMSTLFIREFGVIFHSILIGITLAVAGEEFVVLYVVITFYQTFEALGLGARFAIAKWPAGKAWVP